jgi:choline/glycine/proline betaine transport protein
VPSRVPGLAGELREQGAEAVVLEGVTEENGLPHVGLQVPIGPGDISRGALPE